MTLLTARILICMFVKSSYLSSFILKNIKLRIKKLAYKKNSPILLDQSQFQSNKAQNLQSYKFLIFE